MKPNRWLPARIAEAAAVDTEAAEAEDLEEIEEVAAEAEVVTVVDTGTTEEDAADLTEEAVAMTAEVEIGKNILEYKTIITPRKLGVIWLWRDEDHEFFSIVAMI